MLNRIRSKIEPAMNKLGLRLASTGISPNIWTIIGFIVSIVSALAFASYPFIELAPLYGGLLLLASGFFDIIDGSVARATNQVSKRGAFLDSTLDRVAEVVIFTGIAYAELANSIIVIVAITLSLLVSYARARAESLGVELKGVGIGERAERLLIVAFLSISAALSGVIVLVNYAIIIVAIIAGITFVQRVVATMSRL